MADQPGGAADLHALLIGIDCYLPNAIPGAGTYPSLSGCVRDIRDVEAFLRSRFGSSRRTTPAPTRILKLTSTNTGGPRPPEPPEQWPTYANIIAAFQKVLDEAEQGDQVYIHYSGHGGRAVTQYPELKGAHALDETLVPLDIGYTDARYVRDIELAYLLQKMVDRGLLVTIVLDSCHAGGATRGGNGTAWDTGGAASAAVRGVPFIDASPRPAASLVAPTAELAANWRRQAAGMTRHVEAGAGWLPEPRDYVLLAACRPSEWAHEFSFDGRESNGALTYWWLRCLANLAPGLTYKVVYDQLLGLIHSQFAAQTPILAGPAARTVFGSSHAPVRFAVDVLEVDPAGGRVRLGAGRAHGVAAGDVFALYPAGTIDLQSSQDCLAVVRVSAAGADDAWAAYVGQAPLPDAVGPGAQAVRTRAALAQAQRTVSIGLPLGADPAVAEAVQRVASALAADTSGFLALGAPGRPADYGVAVNAAGEYAICDAALNTLDVGPALPASDPAAAGQVVARLAHLARYRATLELNNVEERSPLANKLRLSLAGMQPSYRPGERPDPQPFAIVTDGIPAIASGQWVFLRIQNASTQILNVAVLDLQPDWGISQVFPTYQDFEPLDPGEERLVPLRGHLPAGSPPRHDMLKAIGTLGPANFRWLELPALAALPAEEVTRAEPRTPAGALPGDPTPRTARAPSLAPDEPWFTAQVTLRVLPEGTFRDVTR